MKHKVRILVTTHFNGINQANNDYLSLGDCSSHQALFALLLSNYRK